MPTLDQSLETILTQGFAGYRMLKVEAYAGGNPRPAPGIIAGAEQAERLLDPTLPSNTLIP